MGDDLLAAELHRLLTEALSRFGVAGGVVILGRTVRLEGHGPAVEVDIGSLQDEWAALAPDRRQRRANDLVRQLAQERRARAGNSEAPAPQIPGWAAVTGAGLLLLAASAGGYVVYRQSSADEPPAPRKEAVIGDYDAYERERAERAARVCEATRSRVMRGAVVGPADVEGWVVELWALRTPVRGRLFGDPGIAKFVAGAPHREGQKIVWSGAPALAAQAGIDTSVRLVEQNVPESGSPVFVGLKLVLTGRYVVPYFDEAGRPEYLRFARAFTDAIGADFAGLYAHCAGGQSHHIGSWFRGPTPGGAVASVLFFAGTFGDVPDVRSSLLVPEDKNTVDLAFAWGNVARITAPLKKARVMALVGSENGMIAGLDDHVSTITFPFRDSNRAARASHAIARDLGIGQDRLTP